MSNTLYSICAVRSVQAGATIKFFLSMFAKHNPNGLECGDFDMNDILYISNTINSFESYKAFMTGDDTNFRALALSQGVDSFKLVNLKNFLVKYFPVDEIEKQMSDEVNFEGATVLVYGKTRLL